MIAHYLERHNFRFILQSKSLGVFLGYNCSLACKDSQSKPSLPELLVQASHWPETLIGPLIGCKHWADWWGWQEKRWSHLPGHYVWGRMGTTRQNLSHCCFDTSLRCCQCGSKFQFQIYKIYSRSLYKYSNIKSVVHWNETMMEF